MPPDDDTLEDQTVSFRRPVSMPAEGVTSEPVHILLLLDDNAPPKRLPLHTLPVVVGRNPPSDLILEDATVSRRHCKLEVRDGQLQISDLGSTNGTVVNGVRLTEPARLQDGASIGVGAFRLRYHRRERDETADADAMDQEWREASKYVASILPKPISEGPVRVNWFYQPSTRIGGDAFGYQMLDERHFSLFLLDVSGHGTGAAMHAMTVAQVLRERVLPHVDFLDPAAVISGLNARFQMARNNDLFFTIWYGVYDIAGRVLTYAAGGHHAAYLLPASAPGPGVPNGAAQPLLTESPLVGMLPDPEFPAAKVAVPPGSTLHLFSDGVFEIIDRDGRQLGLDDVLPMLPAATAGETPGASRGDDPRRLYERIRAIARPGQLDDDFSALVFRFT
jgi:serine phosphatase RsbU (regulator of sigma subunit)